MSRLWVAFLVSSLLLWGENNIEVYYCYGNAHHLVVAGRTLEKHRFKETSPKDNWFKNLWRKAKRFKNDEIKSHPLTASVGNESYETIGDDEGYFQFDIAQKKG